MTWDFEAIRQPIAEKLVAGEGWWVTHEPYGHGLHSRSAQSLRSQPDLEERRQASPRDSLGPGQQGSITPRGRRNGHVARLWQKIASEAIGKRLEWGDRR